VKGVRAKARTLEVEIPKRRMTVFAEAAPVAIKG
jgi:hypothetical protein